jgi:hypothetical protein
VKLEKIHLVLKEHFATEFTKLKFDTVLISFHFSELGWVPILVLDDDVIERLFPNLILEHGHCFFFVYTSLTECINGLCNTLSMQMLSLAIE